MPPFVVLHVCMGNICRSPMAERLLVHAVTARVGEVAGELIVSEGAGTGGWHEGEGMNPPAARELRKRGASEAGFRARKLLGAHIDTADLVLTATADQLEYVGGLRADALPRSFVLGQFGRLVPSVDGTALPAFAMTPAAVHARGVALVTAVDALRAGEEPEPGDDLDDPWGRGEMFYTRTADEIESSIDALVDALFPVV